MLELITGPMTGQQYLDSLQDGREVYIYGERVKDVVTHRAFRNAARSIARLYDALHDRAALRNARCVTTSFTRSDRKSTRLNSSHQIISYAVLCVKKKRIISDQNRRQLPNDRGQSGREKTLPRAILFAVCIYSDINVVIIGFNHLLREGANFHVDT